MNPGVLVSEEINTPISRAVMLAMSCDSFKAFSSVFSFSNYFGCRFLLLFDGYLSCLIFSVIRSDVVKLFDTPQLSGILHFQTLFFIIVRADITQRRM